MAKTTAQILEEYHQTLTAQGEQLATLNTRLEAVEKENTDLKAKLDAKPEATPEPESKRDDKIGEALAALTDGIKSLGDIDQKVAASVAEALKGKIPGEAAASADGGQDTPTASDQPDPKKMSCLDYQKAMADGKTGHEKALAAQSARLEWHKANAA